MQRALIYILYAVQGCSHSPTLISNADNEETAAVTMETTEDTEACEVVPGNSVNEGIQTECNSLITLFRATVLVDLLMLQCW